MANERRRDRRYGFHLPVLLSAGRREIFADTENVSYKGILLRTDLALPERQLVRLRFTLPPEADELTTMGMVVRRIEAADGAAPALGIQLYGLAEEQRVRWDRFVRYVAKLPPGTALPPPLAAASTGKASAPAAASLAAAVRERPARPAIHARYWGG